MARESLGIAGVVNLRGHVVPGFLGRLVVFVGVVAAFVDVEPALQAQCNVGGIVVRPAPEMKLTTPAGNVLA